MATTTSVSGGKKKTAAKAGRKNGLAGFIVDKVDGALMRAYVKKHKLKDIDIDVDDEQLAVALVMHFKETVPAAKQVRCEPEEGGCGAISAEDEESCPICGSEGEVDDEEEVAAAAPSAPESSPDAEEDEDEEDDDDAEDEDSEDEEDDEEEDEEEEDVVAEEAAAPAKEPEVVTPPATTKKSKKEEAAAMKAETHTNGVSTPKKSAALAKTTVEKDSGKMTAADLDKAVAEVQRLLVNSHVSYFEFSQKILEINAKQLWKLRKTEEGKARYTSWDAFVHHELKMSPTHAYNAIECAKNYKSAEEIRELGGKTKAVLLLKAAPVDRPALAAAAKAGATKRELEKGVAESKKKHGPTKTSQQAKAGAKGAKVQAAKKAKTVEKISVANIEGSRTIKLYKKPETMKGLSWPPEKRAAKLGDLPFGRLELQPGVVQYFSVLQKDGELILNIQTRREES